MASTVAGHKRAFGTDTVPQTYEDLDQADLVVLVGSNLAWCHPILHQRVLKARAERGTKLIARCREVLADAEKKIATLTADASGKLKVDGEDGAGPEGVDSVDESQTGDAGAFDDEPPF